MPVGGRGAETGGGAKGNDGRGSGGRFRDNLAVLVDGKLETGLKIQGHYSTFLTSY